MFAKINHLAICSKDYASNARFYQALFGMRASAQGRPARAVPVSDGQIGLNNIPLRDGRRSGLDHLGFEVEDIPLALERVARFDPTMELVQRPSVRPNAAWSGHDPDFTIFDLAQRNSGKAKDVFAEGGWEQPRYINHVTLRARDVNRTADFYQSVFELAAVNARQDGNRYLSDGRVTLVIIPWTMKNFVGHDPMAPGLEHFGFKVESIAALKLDLDDLVAQNPMMVTRPLGVGPEAEARLGVLKQCPAGTWHLTDLEGCHLDVSETDIAAA